MYGKDNQQHPNKTIFLKLLLDILKLLWCSIKYSRQSEQIVCWQFKYTIRMSIIICASRRFEKRAAAGRCVVFFMFILPTDFFSLSRFLFLSLYIISAGSARGACHIFRNVADGKQSDRSQTLFSDRWNHHIMMIICSKN
jgi:hypothetical protein